MLPALIARLGRILPRSIRERIFEPACLDLQYRQAENGDSKAIGRLDLWLRFAGYFLTSFWFALPRYVYEGGSMTLLGRLSLVAILVGTVAFLLLVPWMVELAGLPRPTG